MHAFPLSQAVVSLCLMLGVGVVGDQTGKVQGAQQQSPLKEYHTQAYHVKTGFVPNKTTAVLGEPLTIDFTLKNLSKKKFTFGFGGDDRGPGRHDSFKIGAIDGAGKTLPDPKEVDGRVPFLDGQVWSRHVQSGEVETESLYLPDFRTISKPGVYRVHCCYAVRLSLPDGQDDPFGFTVTNSFQLTILPATKENVRRTLAELIKQVRRIKPNQPIQENKLPQIIERICAFAGEQVVPDLIELSVSGTWKQRLAALGSLAQFPTAAAVKAALTALGDADDSVRVAAAKALGAMKTPEAVDGLLARLPVEKPKTLEQMLYSLSWTKSPRALQPLVTYLDHKEPEVRRTAAIALGQLGGDKALAVLTRCASDDDLERREAVVQTLVTYYKLRVRPEWVLPLIRSGKAHQNLGPNSNGALTLLYWNLGEEKATALVRCLEFKNPATSHLNRSLIHNIPCLFFEGRLVPPTLVWHEVPTTAKQVEDNWQTLRSFKHWLVAVSQAETTPPPSTRPHPPQTAPKSSPKVAQWIAQLGSKKFAEREAAGKALVALGDDDAMDALLWIVKSPTDLETRRRAEKLAWAIERTWESRRLPGYGNAVTGVALCPDGKQVVWCGKGTQAGLWDAVAGKPVREYPAGTAAKHAIAVSPDGQLVLCGEDGAATLWERNTGKVVHTLRSHAGAVTSVAFAADGKRALTGGDDARLYLWDVESGKELRRFLGHGDSVRSVAFAPEGERVLSASLDGTIRLWDLASGRELACLRGHRDAVWAAVFLPDGKRVLSAGCDRTVRLWDLKTGREVRRFLGHTDSIYSLAVTANGQRVVSGGHDGTARLWDVDTGKELKRLRLPFGWVEAVAVSPDGRRAIIGGTVKTLLLWELAE